MQIYRRVISQSFILCFLLPLLSEIPLSPLPLLLTVVVCFPLISVVPECQIIPPSVAANNENDDYGYLQFEIDEDYEREGEYDEEGEDEEEDLMDDDDDDEEIANLYQAEAGGQARFGQSKKELSYVQKTILKNAQEFEEKRGQVTQQQQQQMQSSGQGKMAQRMGMPAGGYGPHSAYYHSSVNDVYTIPEEDEEYEQEQADPREQCQGVGRRQSTSKGVRFPQLDPANYSQQSSAVSGVSPKQVTQTNVSQPTGDSKTFRVPGPIQRILPSTSSSSSSFSPGSWSSASVTSSSMARIFNESTAKASAKARSIRSNSEPFLQMIKPFRRGNC